MMADHNEWKGVEGVRDSFLRWKLPKRRMVSVELSSSRKATVRCNAGFSGN